MNTHVLVRRGAVILSTGALALTAAFGPGVPAAGADEVAPNTTSPVKQRTAENVTADALPTAQIGDGVVWDQLVVGDTVYAGGDFSTARPAGVAKGGAGEVTRQNLLSYSLSTGKLTSFAPNANRQVYAIAVSPDKKRLYVGGAFTTIAGKNRYRIAAFDTATGKLVDSFAPTLDYNVKSIVATNDTVYVGGMFTSLKGTQRQRLAAFRASDGALTSWSPSADNTVQTMLLSPDGRTLFVGGSFATVNGERRRGLAALDASTGQLKTLKANSLISNGTKSSGITKLRTDGKTVYASGYTTGTGNLEGIMAIDPSSGAAKWVDDCHGDTYDTFPASTGVIYAATHAHYCGNIGGYWETTPWAGHTRRALAFTEDATGSVAPNGSGSTTYADWQGQKSPSLYNWFPDLTAGEFTGMGQGAWSVVGNDKYVALGGEFTAVNGQGQQGLTRFAQPSAAPKKRGPKYSGADFTPRVTSPKPGTARIAFAANVDDDDRDLTYRVYRDGNKTTPIATFKAGATFWDRRTLVVSDTGLAQGSTHTYRVSATDADGNTAKGDDGHVTIGDSTAADAYGKAVLGDGAQNYWRLDGTGASALSDVAGLDDLSVSAGIAQSPTKGAVGGRAAAHLSGNGANATTGSLKPAPQQNMSVETWVRAEPGSSGRVIGMSDSKTGTSKRRGRVIYLDDQGRVHWGVTSPGPNWYSTAAINSSEDVADGEWHHVVATVGTAGMQLYVDGKLQATRADMTQASSMGGYWRLGGESLDSWPSQPSKDGLTGDVQETAVYPSQLTAAQVAEHHRLGTTEAAAEPPNQAPTAAFSAKADDLEVSVDGSGSKDADGSIASYRWDFGDGSTGTGATARHTYAEAGTYTVKLTTVDDDGETGTVSKQVKVTAAEGGGGAGAGAGETVAADDFQRSVSNGLGSATTGGAWTTISPKANYSVADGAARARLAEAGTNVRALLGSVDLADVDAQATLSTDKKPEGGNVYSALLARRTSAGEDYRATVQWRTSDTVALYLGRTAAGTQTTLRALAVPGLNAADDQLRVRLRVTGTAPRTTVQAKVWKVGTAEPTDWTATATDTGSDGPASGGVGVEGYLGSTATNAPVTLGLDDLTVRGATS